MRVLTITMLEHRQEEENHNDALHIRLSLVFIPTYVSLLMARQSPWPSSGFSSTKLVIVSPKHTTQFYNSLLCMESFPHSFILTILSFECLTRHHLLQKTCLTILHSPAQGWVNCPHLDPQSLCAYLSVYHILWKWLFAFIFPLANSRPLEH